MMNPATAFRRRPPRRVSALALMLLAFTGCAGPKATQGIPDDFSLDAAVLAPASSGGEEARHFVLHADGALRAGRGRQATPTHYPGLARQLSPTQMVELLNLARQAVASAGQDRATLPTQWLNEPPPADSLSMLLWVRDAGVERGARFDGVEGALPLAAERLRARLSELALMP